MGHLTCWSVLTFGLRADLRADVGFVRADVRVEATAEYIRAFFSLHFGATFVWYVACVFDCAGFVNFAFTQGGNDPNSKWS